LKPHILDAAASLVRPASISRGLFENRHTLHPILTLSCNGRRIVADPEIFRRWDEPEDQGSRKDPLNGGSPLEKLGIALRKSLQIISPQIRVFDFGALAISADKSDVFEMSNSN